MTALTPVPRAIGVLVLLAMLGFLAVAFHGIRRDVDMLRAISQDNGQWSATQMELELARFRHSLAAYQLNPTPEQGAEMRSRFDILWSRVALMDGGEVGAGLRHFDAERGSVAALAEYLEVIDPVVAGFKPGDRAGRAAIETRLAAFQHELRAFALAVVRADADAAAAMRARIQVNARTTALVSIAAVLVSLLTLALILRENRRQKALAEANRRAAEEAEQASRAKSRFLSMMSHELRNPLNGILGPLALIGEGEIGERHLRLVDQAQQSGQSMLHLLTGLLDYGELQDGAFRLRREPFRLAQLGAAIRTGLGAEGLDTVEVVVSAGPNERLLGDADRLRQIFVHLTAYMLEGRTEGGVQVRLAHDGSRLVGDIVLLARNTLFDWKLDLLGGLHRIAADQVSAEALRPLMARALIAAVEGALALTEDKAGRRIIRVTIPAEAARFEQINVHLETRSPALAAIYRAALRSERVVFVAATGPDDRAKLPVDLVLVDSTSASETALMARLRARFPGALFVALGRPQSPALFDDVLEVPNDMSRLRTSVLGRLAS